MVGVGQISLFVHRALPHADQHRPFRVWNSAQSPERAALVSTGCIPVKMYKGKFVLLTPGVGGENALGFLIYEQP